MRKQVVILVLFLSLIPPKRANAGGAVNVFEGFATEVTQYLNQLQLIIQSVQLVQQTKELATQGLHIYQQLEDMYNQAKNLDDFNWGEYLSYTQRLANVVEKGKLMSFVSAGVEERFKELFNGYDDYLESQKSLNREHFENKFHQWHSSINEMLESTFRMNGFTYREMSQDETRLKALERRISVSTGRNELIKSTADVSLFMAEQIRRLSTLIMQQNQTHTGFMAYQKNREALSQARREQFLKDGGRPILGNSDNY